MDIMKGLESASKKYDKSSSDSDNIEYEFHYKKKQRESYTDGRRLHNQEMDKEG